MEGTTISHYKVIVKVGEGGMGIVYKAEDTKLKRPVALKFLAPHLLKDEEARKRFHREAQAAAALHHPNVCTIHEIGEADGHTFLAMAFLEGETLDNKIEQGPLPLKVALDIARQIALGLEAAHEKGVVHRDIKPGNVMIDAKGQVTVMDFGLALLTEGSKLTKFDTTVGTVAYMSPEQAQGVEVDHRTDIWALGCVLYEMTCGQRPFRGVYDQALLYEIAHEEPEPLTGLRTGVPVELERVAGKCLEKDAENRYQNAEDLIVDLRSLAEKLKSGRSAVVQTRTAVSQPAAETSNPLASYRVLETLPPEGEITVYKAEDAVSKRSVRVHVLPEAAAEGAARGRKLQARLLVALACLSAVLAALSLFLAQRSPAPESREVVRFSFPADNVNADPAISPDGRHIAYIAFTEGGRSLWVRDLDRDEPREIPEANGASYPFWSPDSRFIGFAAGGELKTVSAAGVPMVSVCALAASQFWGGAWSPDGGSIVFSSGQHPDVRLYEVRTRGGAPKQIYPSDDSQRASLIVNPYFLPSENGRRLLLVKSLSGLYVRDLDSGEQKDIMLKDIVDEGWYPVYSPSGHVLYRTRRTGGDLWALPYSPETLEAVGEAFPVVQGVWRSSVSRNGTLVYLDTPSTARWKLVWRGRKGGELGQAGQPQEEIWDPRLSPDGSRIVVAAVDNGRDLWFHDASRPVKTRFTFDEVWEALPRWSPRGDEIAYATRGGPDGPQIVVRRSDRSGEAVPQAKGHTLQDWSVDGKHLVYMDNNGLHRLSRTDSGDSETVTIVSGSDIRSAGVSPGGRFVVYATNELGRSEIFVQRFPEGEGKWLISVNGGGQPRWSPEGGEIFYVEGDTLMAVPVKTEPDFSFSPPERLFASPGFGRAPFRDDTGIGPQYDVSADGERFVIVEPAEDVQPSIHVVQNWYEEFRDREQD